MTHRRQRHCRQPGYILFHQGTQFRLKDGSLIQQVGEPADPTAPLRPPAPVPAPPPTWLPSAVRGSAPASATRPQSSGRHCGPSRRANRPRTDSQTSVTAASATAWPTNCAGAASTSPAILPPLALPPCALTIPHPCIPRRPPRTPGGAPEQAGTTPAETRTTFLSARRRPRDPRRSGAPRAA